METNSKTMLAAGGILAVALTIGSQIDMTEKAVPEPVSVQIGRAAKGAEIKALRTANKEVFKADSAWVHPKDAKGAVIKADSFKVAAFTARVYARPKYFMDADGDTLRPLDLTVREISALAKLNPLKTHDRYIDAGPYDARWMNDKPGDFRMDAGGAYVKYRALFKGAAVTVQATENGMKETVALADSTAPKTLRWIVETDGSLVANAAGGFNVRAKDGTVPMRIQRPVAWDAESNPVMASATVEGDTLTFRVTVLPGQKYPVTVDPTTTIKTFVGGYVAYNNGGSYETARDAVTGSVVETDRIYVGQEYAGSVYGVRRGFLSFPGIPSMASASAETLYIRGYNDYSTVDFNINIFGARSFKSALTTADYSKFNGWRSGDTFNGIVLNEEWNSASYTTWNPIIFNTAGRDTLVAATGDTLWIALLSYEDARGAAPGGAQWIYFYGEGSGANEPYISFTYTAPYANPPTGFTLHTPTTSGMKASWTNHHSAGVDSLTRWNGTGVWQKKLDKADTSETITGLSVNTQYQYKARVDSAGLFAYSNTAALYTLANPPVSWAFTEDYDDSTKVNIGFGTNGNPSGTQYAIRDSTAQKWVGSDGIADSAHRVWLTSAQWVSLGKLINRTAAQRQRIGVVARNGDGIETAYVWGALTIGNVKWVQIAAQDSTTHSAKSDVYSNAARAVLWDSISTRAAVDTIGQVVRPLESYSTWRLGLQFVIPDMDDADALACTLSVAGVKDSSATNFNIIAGKGTWTSRDSAETRNYLFSGFSAGSTHTTTNMLNYFNTSSYAASMDWVFSTEGLTRAYLAKGDTLRMTVFSSRDSSATPPTGARTTVNTGTTGWKAYSPVTNGWYTTWAASSDSVAYYVWFQNSNLGTRVPRHADLDGDRKWATFISAGAGVDTLIFRSSAAADTVNVKYSLATLTPEYIVIGTPVLKMKYVKMDTAPTNIVVTAASTTSLIVTWTDNTINEAGFFLVDASTGARIGSGDSTGANVQTATLTGLSVNTLYNIKVKVNGGKLDGELSTSSDECYTLAAVPGKPTFTFPADSLGLIKLDVNGNPSYTEFAIQDSISGLYFDGRFNRFFTTTAAESILWRTYAAWGGTSGDTVKVGVGKKYNIRAKARSGE